MLYRSQSCVDIQSAISWLWPRPVCPSLLPVAKPSVEPLETGCRERTRPWHQVNKWPAGGLWGAAVLNLSKQFVWFFSGFIVPVPFLGQAYICLLYVYLFAQSGLVQGPVDRTALMGMQSVYFFLNGFSESCAGGKEFLAAYVLWVSFPSWVWGKILYVFSR